MNEHENIAPLSEQLICTGCGFCCDGTLFDNAILKPTDIDSLPEKIEQQYVRKEDEVFLLPCPYFCGKCSIYGQHRPSVCGDFRCQVLKNAATDKITQERAVQIVEDAIKFRTELYDLYKQVYGLDYTGSFRRMLAAINAYEPTSPGLLALQPSINILKAKCIIFNILLIKNFKSVKDFERMLDTSM